MLATVDAERCELFNSPAVNRIAATSSDPNVTCVVYREAADRPEDEAFLVVVVNLGDKPARATITLKIDVLGMSGAYQATRIDSATGVAAALGEATDTVTTSDLAPRQIEGVTLRRK